MDLARGTTPLKPDELIQLRLYHIFQFLENTLP